MNLLNCLYKKNKKGVHPVVTVALILVLTVTSTVFFQSWFLNFSSQVFTDVETESSQERNLEVLDVIGDELYFKNLGNNVSITSISINGNDCEINSEISKGVDNISIKSCIESINDSVLDILVVTEKGLLTSYSYLDKSELTNVVAAPASPSTPPGNNCSYNGINVAHLAQAEFFDSLSVPAGETCDSQMRTCNNGTLSGDFHYRHSTCSADASTDIVLGFDFSAMSINEGDGLGYISYGIKSGTISGTVNFDFECYDETTTRDVDYFVVDTEAGATISGSTSIFRINMIADAGLDSDETLYCEIKQINSYTGGSASIDKNNNYVKVNIIG